MPGISNSQGISEHEGISAPGGGGGSSGGVSPGEGISPGPPVAVQNFLLQEDGVSHFELEVGVDDDILLES
jgi:hypothetical protein